MKLQSMTDFVLHIDSQAGEGGHYDKIVRYAKFLKQRLTLGMFIPCDEEGNVLKEPPKVTYFDPTEPVPKEVEQEYYDYLEAKEKVLFEHSFIYEKGRLIKHKKYLIGAHYPELIIKNKTIEYLIDCNITLTPNALKQIGL